MKQEFNPTLVDPKSIGLKHSVQPFAFEAICLHPKATTHWVQSSPGVTNYLHQGWLWPNSDRVSWLLQNGPGLEWILAKKGRGQDSQSKLNSLRQDPQETNSNSLILLILLLYLFSLGSSLFCDLQGEQVQGFTWRWTGILNFSPGIRQNCPRLAVDWNVPKARIFSNCTALCSTQ